MIENPELAERVKKHGNHLPGSGCDFIVLAVELDVRAGVNLARGAQGEVQIQ